jgi:hypothetical protein
MSTLEKVVVSYSPTAAYWNAWFESDPQVAFGSDLPIHAARMLLAGYESPAGEYELVVDQILAGSGVLHRIATWQPPDLLFPCQNCKGTGQHIRFNAAEVCPVCGGKQFLVG